MIGSYLWQSADTATCPFQHVYHLLNVRAAVIPFGTLKKLQLDICLILGRPY